MATGTRSFPPSHGRVCSSRPVTATRTPSTAKVFRQTRNVDTTPTRPSLRTITSCNRDDQHGWGSPALTLRHVDWLRFTLIASDHAVATGSTLIGPFTMLDAAQTGSDREPKRPARTSNQHGRHAHSRHNPQSLGVALAPTTPPATNGRRTPRAPRQPMGHQIGFFACALGSYRHGALRRSENHLSRSDAF